MKLRRRTRRVRPLDLQAGDTIVCNPKRQYLAVVKADGSVVDLNQMLMDIGCTAACVHDTGRLDAMSVMHLAGILAASYGLGASSCQFGPLGLIVPIYNPGELTTDKEPSQQVLDFMRDPRLPSLQHAR